MWGYYENFGPPAFLCREALGWIDGMLAAARGALTIQTYRCDRQRIQISASDAAMEYSDLYTRRGFQRSLQQRRHTLQKYMQVKGRNIYTLARHVQENCCNYLSINKLWCEIWSSNDARNNIENLKNILHPRGHAWHTKWEKNGRRRRSREHDDFWKQHIIVGPCAKDIACIWL